MSTQGLRNTAEAFNEALQPFAPPMAEEVGDYFDRNHEVLTTIYHGNIHYGYWTGPEDSSDFAEATARLTELMIEKLGLGTGARVLDLGCGVGTPAVRLAEVTGAEVVGISVSTKDVEQANARAARAGLAERVSFQRADAMEPPFEDGSFDAVLALGSMIHMPDRLAVLREIGRVLRPGGKVALTDDIKRGSALENDEEAHMLAMVAQTFYSAPPIDAGRYPDLCRRAELVVDEITDITENTKYTHSKMFAGLQAYKAEHGELPPDMDDIFAMGAEIDWDQHEHAEQTSGAIILVAHRVV